VRACGHGTFLLPAKFWRNLTTLRSPEALHEAGTQGHVRGHAQPHDLVFPNGKGKTDGHLLRKLKAIATKSGVEGAELHRFRKTYADTLHEEGVSVNTIRMC
jgi:integrase